MAADASYVSRLAADAAEVEAMMGMAGRASVRALLADYLAQLRAEISSRSPHATGPPSPSVARSARALAAGSPSESAPPQAAAKFPTALPACPTRPVKLDAPSPPVRAEYKTIGSMAWDQDPYGKDPSHVYVYLSSGMDGVGEAKERVSCDFTKDSFDLKILDFGGKNHRLFKSNLEKDIVPGESTVVVKKNRIIIKLRKVSTSLHPTTLPVGITHHACSITHHAASSSMHTQLHPQSLIQ